MKAKKKLIFGILVLGMILSMSFPVSAAVVKVDLSAMHDIESDYAKVIDGGITDSYGKSYNKNVLQFTASYDAFITYDLKGQYDSFDGTIVCGEKTGSDSKISVRISH